MRAPRPLLALAATLLLLPAWLTGARSHAALRAPLALPSGDVVRQSRPDSCAAALLATLLTRAGRTTGEAELLREAPPGPRGLDLHAFASLARSRGLAGRWYRAPDALRSLAPPFVAHLDRPVGHFVWVRDRAGPYLRVTDPAEGEVLWHADALARRFSGRVFRLEAPAPGGEAGS